MNDSAAMLAEIDERVAGYISDLRARAAQIRHDIEAGVLTLQSKGDPLAHALPPVDDLTGLDDPLHDPFLHDALAGDAGGGELGELPVDDFKFDDDVGDGGLLDAPIFGGDGGNLGADDFDFSIDLDPK